MIPPLRERCSRGANTAHSGLDDNQREDDSALTNTTHSARDDNAGKDRKTQETHPRNRRVGYPARRDHSGREDRTKQTGPNLRETPDLPAKS